MYGDQYRSPGRDDRQNDAGPQGAPWETGHAPAPANDDVKVAGSPNSTPPGFYDAGVYETTAMPYQGDTGLYGPSEAAGPGPGAHDGNATAPYAMGNPYEEGAAYGAGNPPYEEGAAHGAANPPYEEGAPYGAGTPPYEAGTSSAMPPFEGGEPPFDGGDAPTVADFEGMRRTPHANNKRLIRFAAVAAAVAVVGGGGVAWAVTGGGSSSSKPDAGQQVQAQAPAPAPLTDAQRKDAEDKRRKELKKRASRAARDEVTRPRLLARGTPPPTKKPDAAGTAGDPVPAGEAQKIARAMLPDFGWSPSSQFGCLVNLWNKESHWNTHAANPSGAYGIPQALPGSKMSSAGPDWQNNARTQIKWGLGYIKDRYSTPCGAWQHSESTGWY